MRACAIVVLLLAGCGGTDQRRLVITGAGTLAPLVAEIGKRFEVERPGVRVDVQTGGSSRGVGDARQGLSDIGLVSRAMNAGEEDLHAFPIARDGVALIVHKDNPAHAPTDDEVVAIYTGKLANWKELGGPDARIVVVNKAEGRSTLEVFCRYFKLKNSDIRAHVVIGDNLQGVKTVAGNPHAVGYVSIGTAEHAAAHDTPLRLLPINGVAASSVNVAAGKFPLARPLHLVTKSKPTGLVKDFLDFATSDKVHDLIREQSFVPLTK